jgi:hypothetical protein
MPRYNVQRPSDGKWACYSSIVEDYITDFMPEDEYQEWREIEYGKHAGPLRETNQMTYEDTEYQRFKSKEDNGE